MAALLGLFGLGMQVLGARIAQAQGSGLSSGLRALIESVQGHRRTAIGYLRTENLELGAVEIERLRERLKRDRAAVSGADAALAAAFADFDAAAAAGLASADAGDAKRAREILESAAASLDAWRRARGIRMLSDCVAEVTEAYERLDRFRRDPPKLAGGAVAPAIVAAVDETAAALQRCDREAVASVRQEAEFRRLVDGMLDSLRQMPGTVEARDGAKLQRLLSEQRSFERLLAFRYG